MTSNDKKVMQKLLRKNFKENRAFELYKNRCELYKIS